jgi:hypothetical protein
LGDDIEYVDVKTADAIVTSIIIDHDLAPINIASIDFFSVPGEENFNQPIVDFRRRKALQKYPILKKLKPVKRGRCRSNLVV